MRDVLEFTARHPFITILLFTGICAILDEIRGIVGAARK